MAVGMDWGIYHGSMFEVIKNYALVPLSRVGEWSELAMLTISQVSGNA